VCFAIDEATPNERFLDIEPDGGVDQQMVRDGCCVHRMPHHAGVFLFGVHETEVLTPGRKARRDPYYSFQIKIATRESAIYTG